jgi:hypothetical protein
MHLIDVVPVGPVDVLGYLAGLHAKPKRPTAIPPMV